MKVVSDRLKEAQGNVFVIKDRCKGCSICVTYCPENVLEMSKEFNSKGYHYPAVENPDDCINCGLCEMFCPDFAIWSGPKKEMIERIGKLHPADCFLRTDSIPSVWCPGCGIGIVVNTFIRAVKKSKIDLNKICVVSGIGCTGKVAEHLNFMSFKTTDGNVFKLAADIKSEDANLIVVVFSHNADFLVSGAADFIETVRKGVDFNVIHINNIIYTITDYEVIPATPFVRISVDQSFILPFNIPHLADSYGAQYVARWTPRHVRKLIYSIIHALQKPGFSIIEVVSLCLMYYTNTDRMANVIERMKFYDRRSVIRQGECTENLDIRAQDKLIIGKFVDKS